MTTHAWKQVERVTVPANDSVEVALPEGRGTLEKLTYWGLSGNRAVANLTFRVYINGVEFGPAYVHVGPDKLAAVVFHNIGGAVDEEVVVPVVPGDLNDGLGSVPSDPMDWVLRVTSTLATDQVVTIVAAAIGRD